MTAEGDVIEERDVIEMIEMVDARTDSLMGLINRGFPESGGDESWRARRIIAYGALCEPCERQGRSKPASHTVDFDVPGACEHVPVCGERDCLRYVVGWVANDLKRQRGWVDWDTFSVDGRGRG